MQEITAQTALAGARGILKEQLTFTRNTCASALLEQGRFRTILHRTGTSRARLTLVQSRPGRCSA